MRRQIVKEPYLVAHIQMLDCLADFLNRAHEKNLTQIFPMTSLREIELRPGEESAEGARQKEEVGRRNPLRYPWAMAPTITITKPVATAIATFVSIDKFIIFPFNYGGNPRRPFFWI